MSMGLFQQKQMKELLVVYGVRKHLTGQFNSNKMFSPAARFGFKRLSSPSNQGGPWVSKGVMCLCNGQAPVF
jgi:hypothetical protein